MNTHHTPARLLGLRRTALVGLCLALASFCPSHAAGPLDPPAAPAPTMRSLDEIYAAAAGGSVNPAAIRSGTYWWDYRLGRGVTSTGPFPLLTVTPGKTFVLTDIYVSVGYNMDLIIYDGADVRFLVANPVQNGSYRFQAGMPFASGHEIKLGFFSGMPANISGCITISGYEF